MRFHIIVDATPKRSDPHGHRRLRGLLKTLWRGWQMRCVSVTPERDSEAGKGNHTADATNAADAR